MTVASAAVLRATRAEFVTAGWTAEQWDDLYDHLSVSRAPGALILTSWLRNPDLTFLVPITPATVLDFLTRYGKQAAQLLTAVDAGATERFTLTFLGPSWIRSDYGAAVKAWQYATQIGLAEPQAVGWAATGYLHSRFYDQPTAHGAPTLSRDERTTLIRAWTDRFGPNAFLYVLAGITADEAATMRYARRSPTQDQLRVMVALNGVILPAGV